VILPRQEKKSRINALDMAAYKISQKGYGYKSMNPLTRYHYRPAWRGARRATLASDAGSALFEFALVLPMLVMLLVGIIKCGILFYDYITLADAVAVGAREMATNQGNTGACSEAEQYLLGAATDLNTTKITVTFPGTTTSGTYSGGNLACSLTANSAGTVEATYPCDLTIPFLGNVWSGCTLTSQTTVRIE
jgi:Flp pilus assembly protein TadG